MRKREFKFSLLIKSVVILLLVILSLVITARYFLRAIEDWDYLKIKEIIILRNNQADLAYLKGRNIFTINLNSESKYILETYPNYRKIRLIRIFPNRLYVDFVRRLPLATIRLYRYFYVDEDLVLFNINPEEQIGDLPVIVGLETKIFGVRSGRKESAKELVLAVDIIKEIAKNKVLRDYKIKKIDAANLDTLSFFMLLPIPNLNDTQGRLNQTPVLVEVKFGQGNVAGKVRILAGLLEQLSKDPRSLKYIDLRFKEPVVKLSTVASK
jgi:cell division septal protein FtsQ